MPYRHPSERVRNRGVTTRSKHWPWLVATLAGLTITLALDTYLKTRDSRTVSFLEPLAERIYALASFSGGDAFPLAPSHTQGATRLSDRDRAIMRLEAQGFKPGGLALARAAGKGIHLAVNLLLRAGISPDACDDNGTPALVAAVLGGHTEVAQRLLDAGANPNLTDTKGRTAFMLAAGRGDTGMMERLAAREAVLTLRDSEGHSAFHHAVLSGALPAINWLVNNQVPAGEECCNGARSLLAHALEGKNRQLLEPVLQHLKPAEWAPCARDALFQAIREADRPLITLLLANHSEAPTPEGAAQPLLGYMIAWGDPAALRLLLECGADPNTPLNSPVEPAFSELVPQKFVRHYLNNEGGMTPLMLAAGMGRLECVQALMEHGAKRGAATSKSKFIALSFGARTTPEVQQVLLGKSPRPEDQNVTVEISLGSQTARIYKDGQVVMSSPVSTGKPGFRTPSGRFVITDKHRVRVSSIYHVPMPYFMRLSCGEVGMHAGNVPNYPASHGCIRLPHGKAASFYRMLEVGTLVIVK